MKLNKSQLVSGWICTILWILALGFWFMLNHYTFTASLFVQACMVLAIIAFLVHNSLNR